MNTKLQNEILTIDNSPSIFKSARRMLAHTFNAVGDFAEAVDTAADVTVLQSRKFKMDSEKQLVEQIIELDNLVNNQE